MGGDKKSMTDRRIIFPLLVLVLFSVSGYGRDISKYEIYGTYSGRRVANPDDSISLRPIGGSTISISGSEERYRYLGGFKAGIACNLNPYIAIAGEIGLNYSREFFLQTYIEDTHWAWNVESITLQQTDAYLRKYTLLAGPRFSVNLLKRFRPYAHFMIGLDRNSFYSNHSYEVVQTSNIFGNETTRRYGGNITANRRIVDSLAIAVGGGLDLRISNRISIRIIDIEVLNSGETPRQYTVQVNGIESYGPPYNSEMYFEGSNTAFGSLEDKYMSNIRFSSGFVFHFGKK